jgi:hypothetical protein
MDLKKDFSWKQFGLQVKLFTQLFNFPFNILLKIL